MPHTDLVLLHAPSVYDFREETILSGPVSDLVPSTTVFEMYPVGFSALAEYLERHGFRVRIVNLAARMVRDAGFDVEKRIRALDPLAFGIDLHWLPHAQGSLAVAALVKKHHPHTPVIFGGFSSSYYWRELLDYPQVDFVVRGDSAEEPLRRLMTSIRDGREPADVPNVVWRDAQGEVRSNPIEYVPNNLGHIQQDHGFVVRAVARYRDLLNHLPFADWLEYPITAVTTCRGCTRSCVTCGGSAYAFRHVYGRSGGPAYRSPEDLASDVKSMSRFSRGPVFILGDVRQAGEDHARRFLEEMAEWDRPVMMEIFDPASQEYLKDVGRAIPNFTLEISLESHDDVVRQAFGKSYTSAAAEDCMTYALEAGCRRLDIFFMIGLPHQTYASVMDTVAYCEHLMKRFVIPDLRAGRTPRFYPFISPLAPFLDPGSLAFEHPERYGYRLTHRTLEEHRRALVQPSWKYILNYETEWMDRAEIVASSYEAGRRLNRLKAEYGLIDTAEARAIEARIEKAMALSEKIDRLMEADDAEERGRRVRALKPEIDGANLSTVCNKRELNLPMGRTKLDLPRAAWYFLKTEVLGLQKRAKVRSGGNP